jgi:signal transduction histidine kinase
VKLSLAARLGLSYLLVILVGMGLIAPLAWLAVERLYVNTQSASLLAQAQLIAAALNSNAAQSTSPIPYSQTTNTLPGIHTRVIDAQGGVVIDFGGGGLAASQNGLDLPQLAQNSTGLVTSDELMSRPEVAEARAGQPATAVRQAPAAGGQQVLYAAAPVLSSDGSVIQIVYLATPLPDTRLSALPEGLRWQFAGVILAAIFLASAAGMLLARQIARPLSNLAGAAQAVAEGHLDHKVPEDASITELAQLGHSFNSMTASLHQADLAKTAFISDVSHELRTPLTVLKGTIETLQDGALDDRKARGPFLASMNQETERLIRLVNDLLVLTRADAGALNLQLHRLDLAELAGSRCQHFKQAASRRRVSLTVVAESGFYLVQGDADRLAQVLDNLLDNAIRYAPAGSQVSIKLDSRDGRVTCQITDCGPGIAAQHLPLIFERFYRADAARGRGQGGSGLGLSIVRSLVLAHGGQVSADSLEGHGATLSFWLPAFQD